MPLPYSADGCTFVQLSASDNSQAFANSWLLSNAERFFLDKDPAIVAWGSTQNVPDYTLFQRRTFWLRY